MIGTPMSTVRQQLRDNAVAITSLIVALTALGYNTWRNERTGAQPQRPHRRLRGADAFGRARTRGVFLAQYDHDTKAGSPRAGWTYVLAIRDLAGLEPQPSSAERAAELQQIWGANWEASSGATRRPPSPASTMRSAGCVRPRLATLRSLR